MNSAIIPSIDSTFESMVSQLVGMGWDRPTAESEIRRQYPKMVTRLVRDEARSENVREKEEQAFIAKLFRGFGCKVYSLSQARASKQTPGLPDLWVVHRDSKRAWWFECKRSGGGRLSGPQREFAEECHVAGLVHVIGDRRDASHLLLAFGLARVGDGPCGIVPFHGGR